MKTAIVGILLIILMAVWLQAYFILKENNNLKASFLNLSAKAQFLTEENEKLGSEIEYFSRPENLEKELRSKFNYKKPGEKMIIVVP
ncbi:MAG: septum formation initiator family protein [Patescibacteria group bacterium]